MERKLVVGNWKMNGDLVGNQALFEQLVGRSPGSVDTALCLPFPYLAQGQRALSGSATMLGAQNLSEFDAGAYTGEVSGAMLADFDCRFVIVGHSERRALFHEDDLLVARKARAALAAGLAPIVCVGESLVEREAGRAEDVLLRQLDALARVLDGASLSRLVIAYEPVWAIGTGRAASPEQVQAILSFVRGWLARHVVDSRAVRVLYGGSVKADRAAALFSLPDSDGGLIGGASLIAKQFLEICEAAAVATQDDDVSDFKGSR
ncbi:triose-phosphate isomerase [Aromatoleum bremense]|uniref:Triosephosphate isomerase n=1 Tax=Aromatoleum bremense TaxID=76115 RepID=A0ABX1NUU3_9RHOO|nr:triose-phosphate isomerase [Aromatoleum bremense]NMG15784.1 triose-phosphate isomerase [Aromatoleum bremense]QTQ30669.1 Triosephosphate isomerase [Aromatoleum bremense]